MKAKPEHGTTSFARFAGIFGCAPSYVTQLKAEGRLVLTDNGKRIHTRESLARIAATADPAKTAVAARHAAQRWAGEGIATPTPPAAPDDADEPIERTSGYQHWRERSEKAKALALERDNAIADGKLLDAGEVTSAVAAAVTTLRGRLEGLPDVLGPQLAGVNDEAQARALLAEAIEHALEEAARQFSTMAKQVTT